mmetsp:Transcript_20969/g.35792  ORF Transcript_20969/g.35792 Transcript_20969/m.35792 type:complete len:221 (+) Transcript_20969:66-728(+)
MELEKRSKKVDLKCSVDTSVLNQSCVHPNRHGWGWVVQSLQKTQSCSTLQNEPVHGSQSVDRLRGSYPPPSLVMTRQVSTSIRACTQVPPKWCRRTGGMVTLSCGIFQLTVFTQVSSHQISSQVATAQLSVLDSGTHSTKSSYMSSTFLICDDQKPQHSNEGILQVGVVVHQNGDHPHVGQNAHCSPHDVVSVQPVLPLGIQPSVVRVVVVALCQYKHLV